MTHTHTHTLLYTISDKTELMRQASYTSTCLPV